MQRETVLVTGGAGFIGSHLVERLVGEGYRVRVLDDVSSGSFANLGDAHLDIELIEGSILDTDEVARAVRGVRAVFHEAAISTVMDSMDDPLRSNDINVAGTLNLLVASRDSGVERLVYASSSAIYGETEVLPLDESMPLVPLSPYGVSKMAGELYCRSFTEVYAFPTISLRYFNVFGPRQDPKSQYSAVIPRFIEALLKGNRLVIYGDGTQSRDFTFVENVIHANVLALRAPEEAFGQAFNVAHGERHSLNELVIDIAQLIGRASPEVEYAPPRAGDILHSQASISRASRILGYQPSVSFVAGLSRTIDWLRGLATRSNE